MEHASIPSDAEMAVLKAFWREGPMSTREAQEALVGELNWASSTVRTVLERMRAKGLLHRRAVHGVAVYSPTSDKVSVLGGALNRLVRSVLEVRGELPASAFAGSEILTPEELEALHRLLNASPEDEA
jgi:predicted transcriptional regulator